MEEEGARVKRREANNSGGEGRNSGRGTGTYQLITTRRQQETVGVDGVQTRTHNAMERSYLRDQTEFG